MNGDDRTKWPSLILRAFELFWGPPPSDMKNLDPRVQIPAPPPHRPIEVLERLPESEVLTPERLYALSDKLHASRVLTEKTAHEFSNQSWRARSEAVDAEDEIRKPSPVGTCLSSR